MVFAVALLLRLFVSPQTLIHENAHGYEYLRTAFSGQGYPFHGTGYYAFYRLITLAFGQEPIVVFGCNAILSSLTAGALVPVGTLLTDSRRVGFFTGLVYALWPAALRIAATESMFPLALFVAVITLGVWLSAVRSGNRTLYVLAGLLLAVAVQVRPVMLLWPIIVAISSISQPKWSSEPAKAGPWLSAAVFLVLASAWLSFRILDLGQNGMHSVVDLSPVRAVQLFFSSENLIWNNRWSPTATMVLATLGLAVLMRSNWRLATFVVLSGAILCWFALAPSEGAVVSQLRLQSPVHVFVALSAGAGSAFVCEQLPGRHRMTGTVVLSILLFVSSALRYDAVREYFNPQREYEFLRESIAKLPNDCIVVTADRSMANGVITTEFPDWWLESRPRIQLADLSDARQVTSPSECIVWYRGLSCYSFTWQERSAGTLPRSGIRQECQRAEEAPVLTPIVTTSIENQPYLDYIRPQNNTLELGFYRLEERPVHE